MVQVLSQALLVMILCCGTAMLLLLGTEHLLGEVEGQLLQEVHIRPLRLESAVRINGEEDGKSEGNQRVADGDNRRRA